MREARDMAPGLVDGDTETARRLDAKARRSYLSKEWSGHHGSPFFAVKFSWKGASASCLSTARLMDGDLT